MNHAEILKKQLQEQLRQVTGFTSRLDNWARYFRDHSTSTSHCRSIEHRYRSPQCWYPEDPIIPTDSHDALRIERALSKLPEFVRTSLAAHYVFGGRWEQNHFVRRLACKDIACHKSQYHDMVLRAEKMLENHLLKVDNRYNTRQM